jgi:membrane protein implicated in regulation of membrane protease activity
MIEKDTSKPKIHSATTYKLYIISCIIVSSGMVLMLKFPEMHTLESDTDPLFLMVYGLSIKVWKIIHILASFLFLVLTGLHIYFNREWIRKVGSKKLNLNVTIGLLIGIIIILAGIFAPHA